ncbi:MAG: hypothetical protein EZS28_035734 [Streblomastix strix]|uniref:SPRY domain-containing protein n=1 Tax=Streblomastix strix TaxID=222440 RepID=A0A5J4UF70_9EUKA|nr:MAG: hypothetical protein EZS28_035734 [Streblomastix strix]
MQIQEKENPMDETQKRKEETQKRIIEAKNENEKLKAEILMLKSILEFQTIPIDPKAIIIDHNNDKQQGDKIIHLDQLEPSTVSFDPVVNDGIVHFEGIFYGCERFGIGVADESVEFAPGWFSADVKSRTIEYQRNQFWHRGFYVQQDVNFSAGQRIAFEVNLSKTSRTLRLFVNEQELKHYAVNIPQAIRFFIVHYSKKSQFQITRFEQILVPQLEPIGDHIALKWGTKWSDNN